MMSFLPLALIGPSCSNQTAQPVLCEDMMDWSKRKEGSFYVTIFVDDPVQTDSDNADVVYTTLILSSRPLLTEPGALLIVAADEDISGLSHRIAEECAAIVQPGVNAYSIQFHSHDSGEPESSSVLGTGKGLEAKQILEHIKKLADEHAKDDETVSTFISRLFRRVG
jgi:hypothetical protein